MERLLALLALFTMIGFLGIIGYFVPEPDLLAVFAFAAVLTVADFWPAIAGRAGDRD